MHTPDMRNINKVLIPIFLLLLLLTAAACGSTNSAGSMADETGTAAESESGSEESSDAEQTTAEASSAYLFAMDTVMQLTVYGGGDDALDAASALILDLEELLSATTETSDIAVLNATGTVTLDDEILALLEDTIALSERTGGAMDPTAYSLVKLWGFTTEEYQVPSQEAREAAIATVGTENISIEGSTVSLLNGAQIDLGAVTKGYTGQALVELMADYPDVQAALFTLGGNVQTYGQKPDGSAWRVGIQDPDDDSSIIAILTLPADTDCLSVVTSGIYQRYFEEDGVRYHHIMDTSTGAPADSGLSSVTIVCEDGLLADALSTALLVMGLEEGAAFWAESDDFEAVFITTEGEIYITEGITDMINEVSCTVIGRDT